MVVLQAKEQPAELHGRASSKYIVPRAPHGRQRHVPQILCICLECMCSVVKLAISVMTNSGIDVEEGKREDVVCILKHWICRFIDILDGAALNNWTWPESCVLPQGFRPPTSGGIRGGKSKKYMDLIWTNQELKNCCH